MTQLSTLALALVTSIILLAAIMDILWRRVSNLLTISLICSGAIYHAVVHGIHGVLGSVVAVGVAVVVLVIPFLMGGLGGGDVKLLAGVGAWVLLPDIVWIFIIAGLLAGVCGFLLSLMKDRSLYITMTEVLVLRYRMANVGAELDGEAWGKRKVTDGQPKRNLIPFALLIAIGTLARFFIVYRWN